MSITPITNQTPKESQAFAEAVGLHYQSVLAACSRQAPREEIDDCVQAVFLVLGKRGLSGMSAPSLLPWLLRVAHFVCSRARRGAQRRQRTQATAVLAKQDEQQPDDEVLEQLNRAMMTLDERQRVAVTMHIVAGKDASTIACHLGISQANVYKIIERGMEKLRTHMRRRGVPITTVALLIALRPPAQAMESSTRNLVAILSSSHSPYISTLALGAAKTMTITASLPWIATASIAIIAGAGVIIAADTDSTPEPVPVSVIQHPPEPLQPLPHRETPDTITAPSAVWAAAQGKDQFGYWADLNVRGVTQRMRWCAPGQFTATRYTVKRIKSAWTPPDLQEVQYHVTLTKGFWIADSACTEALWRAVMGAIPLATPPTGPAFPSSSLPATVKKSSPVPSADYPQRPVVLVSWDDVQRFFSKVNALMPRGAILLPTEAQREYACRAGTQTPYAGPSLDALGWYLGNSGGEIHPVKQKSPNPWGLYDMHGNVNEWCADWDGDVPIGNVTDPTGPSTGSLRVYRGGSYGAPADSCQSAKRFVGNFVSGDVGFRFLAQSDHVVQDNGTKDF